MYAQRCFACLWDAFALIAPRAARLRSALAAAGYEAPVDHIGVRTVAAAPIGLTELERHLLAMDYHRCSQARAPDAGMAAASWRGGEAHLPRLAMVELACERLETHTRRALERILADIEPRRVLAAELLWSGRPWGTPRYEDWASLVRQDAGLGWILAMGLRPAYVALQLDHARGLDLDGAIALAREARIPLRRQRILGMPVAVGDCDRVPVEFAGGRIHELPSARVVRVDPRERQTMLPVALALALARPPMRPASVRGGHSD